MYEVWRGRLGGPECGPKFAKLKDALRYVEQHADELCTIKMPDGTWFQPDKSGPVKAEPVRPRNIRRSNSRYDVALPIVLPEKNNMVLATNNVSQGGLFVATEQDVCDGDLLRLRLLLPHGNELEALGTVVRSNSGGTPGLGIRLYSLRRAESLCWNEYISRLDDGSDDFQARDRRQPSPNRDRRDSQRSTDDLRIGVLHKGRLRSFAAEDVSETGMFLKATELKNVQGTVELVATHPRTRRRFLLRGRIVRKVDEGVGIRFEKLSPAHEAAFLAFLRTGLNRLDNCLDANAEKSDCLKEMRPLLPQTHGALLKLGRALLEELNFEAATEALQRANELDPTCKETHRYLVDAYRRMYADRFDKVPQTTADREPTKKEAALDPLSLVLPTLDLNPEPVTEFAK